MSNTVQNIKERLSIIDVISSYIDVEKSGANFKAKCPFHHEKTPSFFISPDRNTYYCFGCGVKGDIFTFVQEFEGIDFLTTLKMLADRAGVVIEKFEKREDMEELSVLQAMEEATKFFQSNLKNNVPALTYLKNRSLNIETLRKWRLGFATREWRELKTFLMQKGFSEKVLLDAGLIKANEKGESYDRFRGRIMFPIFDTAGHVIAFSGRILDEHVDEPKYLNSPDTILFDKSKTLYGFNVAKSEIRQRQSVVLVEGQMDLLMSHQSGVTNTVASSGTALTTSHLELLRRLTHTIIIAYDGDTAGKNATLRAWKLALKEGFDTKVAFLPQGMDPADAVIKDPEIWKNAISQAQGIIDYFILNMKAEEKSVADATLKEKILPLIKSVSNAIDRSRFIQQVSFASGISENALQEELSKISDEETSGTENSLPKIEKTKIAPAIGFYMYLDSKNDAFLPELTELLKDIDASFETKIPDDHNQKSKILFEMEMLYGESAKVKQVAMQLLHHFEEDKLKQDFAETMERLKKSELIHDMESVERELKHCQEISLKLSGLSKKYTST